MEKDLIACPRCQNGHLIRVDENNKTIYKCNECDYINSNVLSVISGKRCPECNDFLILRRDRMHKRFYKCHNPDCSYSTYGN